MPATARQIRGLVLWNRRLRDRLQLGRFAGVRGDHGLRCTGSIGAAAWSTPVMVSGVVDGWAQDEARRRGGSDARWSSSDGLGRFELGSPAVLERLGAATKLSWGQRWWRWQLDYEAVMTGLFEIAAVL
ncbi:hypothetical protein M0R45_006887 [Rubus argutus]|uniref:Uncharacterized protein n=1 Tax=Rubus argutus TaxID=59490 RepID=A0AAW1YSF8_RUBAR